MYSHGNYTENFVRGRRYDRELFSQFVDSLGSKEIAAMREIDGTCPTCGSNYWGVLDQGQMTIPIGLKWRIDPSYKKYIFYKQGIPLCPGKPEILRYDPYMARMSICRSGIWSRSQLKGGYFTQHELEVNDRMWDQIRPRKCDCHYGSPVGDFYEADELEMLRAAGILPYTKVEEEFINSNPVRTGFRRRSKDAIIRRRNLYKQRKKSRGAYRYSLEELLALNKSESSNKKLFYVIKRKHKRAKRTPRSIIYKEMIKSRRFRKVAEVGEFYTKVYFNITKSDKAKYKYFKRKRGKVYLSLHNP